MAAKPKRFDRNLVVIGAGAAGLVSSYIAATVKAKVTLIEKGPMGGDCLNYGCVPSKALIHAAKVAATIKHGKELGLNAELRHLDFPKLMQSVNEAIHKIEPHDSVERYQGLGVDVIKGEARILDRWRVEIKTPDGEGQVLTTRAIIIATGAAPIVPDIEGLERARYVTSETLWHHLSNLQELPKHIAILGGGPIGCELAQAFARLGSEVSLIDRGSRLLKKESKDASATIMAALEKDGVKVMLATTLESCGEEGRLFLKTNSEAKQASHELKSDLLMLATGRRPRLKNIGLEALGIDPSSPLEVDDYLRSRVDNVYFAGDVAGRFQFTHVAAHEAWYASVNSLFSWLKKFRADYRVIPRVTFTDPQVASVGRSVDEGVNNDELEVTRYNIAGLDRAIAESANLGCVEVLTKRGKDQVLGVSITAAHAGEMLPEFVSVMKRKKGLGEILNTIHAYPTWSEANKYLAGEWKKKHKPEFLLSLLAKIHAWRRR